MSLDRSKPHGEVYGHCAEYPGARVVQDGRYYAADGREIARVGTVADDAPVTPSYTVDEAPSAPKPDGAARRPAPDEGTVYEASDVDVDLEDADPDVPITLIHHRRARMLVPDTDTDRLREWLAEERAGRKRGSVLTAIEAELESRESEHPESETAQTPE